MSNNVEEGGGDRGVALWIEGLWDRKARLYVMFERSIDENGAHRDPGSRSCG